MTASEYITSSILPGSSHDLFQRSMRIKAHKAYEWMQQRESLYHLLITVATVSPMESIMFRFLKWQHENSMYHKECSPLATMSTSESPARRAVDSLLQLMLLGKVSGVSDESVTIFDIAQGQNSCKSGLVVLQTSTSKQNQHVQFTMYSTVSNLTLYEF